MSPQSMSQPVVYKDRIVRIVLAIIAAHLIVIYGEEKTTFEVLLSPDYYYSFLVSLAIAGLLIQYIFWVTGKLDRKFDWIQMRISAKVYTRFAFMLTPYFAAN